MYDEIEEVVCKKTGTDVFAFDRPTLKTMRTVTYVRRFFFAFFPRRSIFRTAEMLDFQRFSPFFFACLSLICRLNLQADTRR